MLPVGKPDGSGETLQLRVTAADLEGDRLLDVVGGFCTSHGITDDSKPKLAKAVYQGMYAAAAFV